MHRKLIWLSILSILFLVWGASGTVAASHQEPLAQSALSSGARTPGVPQATAQALIPVTGNPSPGWGTLVFYGLIGFAALTLILALLDSANRSTALYTQQTPLKERDRKID